MSVIAIARQTFQFARQSRLLFTGVVVGCALIIVIVGGTSLGVRRPVGDAISLGLWLTLAFSTIFGAIVPVQTICTERQNRAIYLTLSMPISRTTYILGRWLGCWFTVFIISISMLLTTSALIGLLAITSSQYALPSLLPVIFLQTLEIGVITAVGVLFASFTTPVLATLYTLALVLATHFADDIEKMSTARGASETEKAIYGSIIPFFPDMSIFDVRTNVAMGFSINSDIYFWAPLFGITMTAIALALAIISFQTQDVK